MPHPQVDNETPAAVEPLFLDDEEGYLSLSVVVRATFVIEPDGRLLLAEEQAPLCWGGERYDPDAEQSSYLYEPEIAPLKVATDVAVIGSAHAPRADTSVLDVGIRVGDLGRTVRVFGDRVWYSGVTGYALTQPRTFWRIPLVYERAFGGWDRSQADPEAHRLEARNPVGRGFHAPGGAAREHDLAPNIEDPAALIRSYRDAPPPAGLGFTSHHWQPRAAYAGTYDAIWEQTRSPLLPADFDLRYHSGASPGMVAQGYLRGDEVVYAVHLTPGGRLHFRLPGVPEPEVTVNVAGRADMQLRPKLDTVILDFDAMRLVLLWRERACRLEDPSGLSALRLRSEQLRGFPTESSILPPASSGRSGGASWV